MNDDKGKSIWGKNENVVVGDNLKMKCGEYKYNYNE